MSPTPRGTPPSKSPACGQITKPGNMGKGFVTDTSHTPQQYIQFQGAKISVLTQELESLKQEVHPRSGKMIRGRR